jgi:hypothetical protein
VNHPILFPADVAFKFDDEPHATVEGDAVTEVGAANESKVTVTEARAEIQPETVGQVIIT